MDKNSLCNFLLGALIDNCQPTQLRKRTKYKNLKRKFICASGIIERGIPTNKEFLTAINSFPDDIFQTHFKMSKSTFEQLEMKLKLYWHKSYTGRPGISLKNALYLTIWKLVNSCSYRELCDRFNISKGNAHQTVSRVTALISKQRKEFIKWPSTQAEYSQKMEDFKNLRRFPVPYVVVGCLDKTHIEISAPPTDSESYCNEKGTHSIILQAVCDSRCVFMDVYFGWPGRTQDATTTVWQNSPLGKGLANGHISLPEGSYILGDSTYPLSTYLMVPFRDDGHQNENQKKFNTCLSSTRVCIEQGFEMLKNKFRILKYLEVQKLQEAKHIVLSCVALHNHIINCEGVLGYDKVIPQTSDDIKESLK